MAGGVNKVILIGNLGRDPELRYTQGGSAVCQLNLATTRSYNNREGERVEDTEWHRVVVWGKQAEFCEKYLNKGRQCYVEGRLQTRNFDDKEGHKRYITEIVADTVQFLGGRGEGGGDGGRPPGRSERGGGGSSPAEGGAAGAAGAPGGAEGGWNESYIPSDPGDDDIPF